MWLREPVLILTIAVAALGLLFAIRRILGETSATSSDGPASNPEASRGNAGVVAPPPVIFLGFLALAAVLEALVPSPTATSFPYARYVAGTVLSIIGFLVGIAGAACVLLPPISRRTYLRRRLQSTASTDARATRSISR